MAVSGVGPSIRVLSIDNPTQMANLFRQGQVLEADVLSVFEDKAVLSFGPSLRLEVDLQANLKEGQRVRVQVQPRADDGRPVQGQPLVTLKLLRIETRPGSDATQVQRPVNPDQPTIRVLGAGPQVSDRLAAGQVLEGEVVSVSQEKVLLSFGPGLRLEVERQPNLKEGHRVWVQGEPRPDDGRPIQGQTITSLKLLRVESHTKGDAPQAMRPPVPDHHPQSIAWLPIPLPGGEQGWAQIQVKDDQGQKAARPVGAEERHQVRLWWETPSIGAVEVTLDSLGHDLSAIFTAALTETRLDLEAGRLQLQEQLTAAGFPNVRIGSRTAAPGDPVLPASGPEGQRLDRRM